MPAVLMNAAVPAPGVGPAGPASPTDPVPADDGAFAAALAEARDADAEDETPTAAADAGIPALVAALATLPPSPNALPPENAPADSVTVAALVPGAPVALGAPTPASEGATSPGWPPPGLAALFPTAAIAGDPPSPSAAMTAAVTWGPTTRATGPEAAAPPASAGTTTLRGLLAGLAGVAPPNDAVGPEASRSAAPTVAAPAPATTPAALAAPIVAAADAAIPLKLEALRAMAVPVAVREAIAAVGEPLAAPIGPDGLDVAAWSPLAPTPLPRLDLAAAFPAPVPVHDPRLAEAMATRVQWMAERGGGEVTLRVAPEGLGPVEIRLQLDGDRVDLGLQAAQAETRQALQDALPKLREMLSQSGLQLGHADVGQRQSSGASPNGDGRDGARSFGGDARGTNAADDTATPIVVRSPPRGNGLLDLYA